MKKKIAAISVYIAIFRLSCTVRADNFKTKFPGEYRQTINTIEYQLSYNNTYSPVFSPYSLYTQRDSEENTRPREKTAYLTFDDGPSPRTGEILDILEKYDIKATFFVVRGEEKYTEYMKRAAREGHTIGVHSSSHKYKEIYKSVEDYLADFDKCYNYILDNTGTAPRIYRMPGGSVNDYNKNSRKEIVREMGRRGFVYFNWNVESGDSSNSAASTICNNVLNGCKGKQRAVIIMHDAANKKATAEALEDIIVALKEDGWVFAPLTNQVKPMIFRMK